MKKIIVFFIIVVSFLAACNKKTNNADKIQTESKHYIVKDVRLQYDLSAFDSSQVLMIRKFIKIAHYIDTIFYYENYGDFKSILDTLTDTLLLKKYQQNYGPWDRFNDNKPFIDGVGAKPLGANFYPKDITRLEFYEYSDSCKFNPYTFIRRDKTGHLYCVPYHIQLKKYINKISVLLNEAAKYAENKQFAKYLRQRAKDLLVDNYFKSDSLWINLNDNTIDFIIGPVYVSEDKLMNIKAEHQAIVLIKDTLWTAKLSKYLKWLKYLQKAIPVEPKYRAEEPGINSTIVVVDAIYFGGSGRAGGTLISELFPLDTKLQLKQGVKNLQFRNIINYKFNEIIKPLSEIVLVDYQDKMITQNAFFENNLLYEIANSLGIRNTINNKGTVQRALKNYYTISDYIKNYSLSLFLANELFEVGEIKSDLKENYYTFVVNLVRLARFGETSDYALANIVIFNYLLENNAIRIENQKLVINFDKMQQLIIQLSNKIIVMQGNGDYEGMKTFVNNYNKITPELQKMITTINDKNIPTDINLIEGEKYLKLP